MCLAVGFADPVYRLISYFGFVLSSHCGPMWGLLDLILSCGLISQLDLRPALATRASMMVKTLVDPAFLSQGLWGWAVAAEVPSLLDLLSP